MARWSCSARAKGSRPKAKPSGGRPTNTKCRGWRSSTSSTAKGPISKTVFGEISKRLAANPVAIQIPVGQGPPHVKDPFRGIIDLVEMKLLYVRRRQAEPRILGAGNSRGAATTGPNEWRAAMLEKLYDYSNELMELALQEQPIPPDLIRRVLREATVHLQIQPVLCGSALHGIGVQPVLDAVQYYLPSPLDVPPVEGRLLEKNKDGSGKNREAKALARRAVLRPGLQNSAGEDRRHPLDSRLFRLAQAKQPRAESGQGSERKRLAVVDHPRHEARRANRRACRPATSSA